MMVIDMDIELQRLICMSMDKMTMPHSNRHKEDRPAESRKRKCGGLNLRKALLVAHVLQDMRNAYISDDYTKLLNTIRPDLKHCDKQIANKSFYSKEDTAFHENKATVSDEWLAGRIERPTRSLCTEVANMEVDTPLVQPQNCAMRNDITMSRSSQFTYPVPVSVNTKYVLSPRMTEDANSLEFNEEIPEVCQQIEVVSDNDCEITEPEHTTEIETKQELVHNLEISMDSVTIGIKPTLSEKLSDIKKSEIPKEHKCPLPRKKRPLPKELIEEFNNEKINSESKRIRLENETTCATSAPCYSHNSTTSTTQSMGATFSSLASSTHSGTSCTYVTTSVTSQISTTSSTPITATTGLASSPRVVVEVNAKMSNPLYNNPMWSSWQLPATCRTNVSERATAAACAKLISERNITNIRRSTPNIPSAHMPMMAC